MPWRFVLSALCLVAAVGVGFAETWPRRALAQAATPAIEVVGATLRVRLADGRTLTGNALTGAVLTISDAQGRPMRVRIDGAERDPKDPRGERWLYRLMAHDPVSNVWHNFCQPGPEGFRLGFPVRGTTSDDGGFVLSTERLSFTCTSGAIAKCIRMGYEPWDKTARGQPLLDHFRACMRMVRADYCGDGQPHTRDGTLINIYDRLGIQVAEPAPDLSFEAAWGPEGAVCVRKTRIGAVWTLDDLKATCPARLAGRIGPDCSEAAAMSIPEALIFNQSRDAP